MECITLTKNEGIALLTINRPNQLNALNKQTLGEISAAFEGMRDDVETKVVILTGSCHTTTSSSSTLAWVILYGCSAMF